MLGEAKAYVITLGANMDSESLILAIDGGGSASRTALYREDGTLVSETIIGPLSCKSSGCDAVAASLTELRGFLGSDSLLIRAAVFGLSGLDSPEDFATMGNLLIEAGICDHDMVPKKFSYGYRCESAWNFPILLCSDALLPLFGNGFTEGTVVISGTGSVALRIGPRGKIERFGGWGYMTSDEGSGCWIGCEFMREALHVADEVLSGHTSPSKLQASSITLLEEAFLATRKQWGSRVPTKSTLERKARFLREWATAHDDPKAYASLARSVMESKATACRSIRQRASQHLAWLANISCVKEAPVVVFSGGIFLNAGFADQTAKTTIESSKVKRIRALANKAHPTIGAFALAQHVWPED